MPAGTSNPVSVPSVSSSSPAWRVILGAGAIAGTLDILSAVLVTVARGRVVTKMLQGIASGLLGKAAMDGGAASAALGLLCHYTIALGATAVFYAASRKLSWLVDHAVVSGVLYGVAVYAFMNSVVVPLSAIGTPIPYKPLGLAIHIVCVGLPIALGVRWLSRPAAA